MDIFPKKEKGHSKSWSAKFFRPPQTRRQVSAHGKSVYSHYSCPASLERILDSLSLRADNTAFPRSSSVPIPPLLLTSLAFLTTEVKWF